MKKVMFALCFMFGGVVAVSAQDTQDTTSNQYRTETQSQYPQDAQTQDQDRERIQSTELPDEVKRSLEGQEYRGWLISGAFKAKGVSDKSSMESDTTSTETDPNRQADNNATGAQAEEVYIVELKNGAETKTVRFGKDGQKMEGMEEEDSQNSQNNQYNQNEQTEQPAPNAQPAPGDPNSNTQQSNESQSPDQSSETQTETSPETQSEKSTETQSDKSTETQPEQSKANKPE